MGPENQYLPPIENQRRDAQTAAESEGLKRKEEQRAITRAVYLKEYGLPDDATDKQLKDAHKEAQKEYEAEEARIFNENRTRLGLPENATQEQVNQAEYWETHPNERDQFNENRTRVGLPENATQEQVNEAVYWETHPKEQDRLVEEYSLKRGATIPEIFEAVRTRAQEYGLAEDATEDDVHDKHMRWYDEIKEMDDWQRFTEESLEKGLRDENED